MKIPIERRAWLPAGFFLAILLLAWPSLTSLVHAEETQNPRGDSSPNEVWTPEPAIVLPGRGAEPLSDAIILFDGSDLGKWRHEDGSAPDWHLEDGVVTVAGGSGTILTRDDFGDMQLHIEWRAPAVVEGVGQGRGNSGVFLQRRYEVQILDSYDNPTYVNGQAASIYKQHIPLVNASRPPGEWQTYDIIFIAPRFAVDGAVQRPAFVTLLHNGVLVHNHVEIRGTTRFLEDPAYEPHALKQPLLLQDHWNPVSFRNIWVRELGE